MNNVYVFLGYLFRKDGDATDGGAYYTIIHPDGRYLDRNHYFASESDIEEWAKSR